jgi:hypothetical protein
VLCDKDSFLPLMVVKSLLSEIAFFLELKKRPKEALLRTLKKAFSRKSLKRQLDLGQRNKILALPARR